MSLEIAVILLSGHSLHSLLAAVATFALTMIPRPIALERWYLVAWLLPFFGPVWAGLFTWHEFRRELRRTPHTDCRQDTAASLAGAVTTRS